MLSVNSETQALHLHYFIYNSFPPFYFKFKDEKITSNKKKKEKSLLTNLHIYIIGQHHDY